MIEPESGLRGRCNGLVRLIFGLSWGPWACLILFLAASATVYAADPPSGTGPDPAQAIIEEAVRKIEEGRPDDALAACRKALAQNPQSAWAFNVQGTARLATNQWPQALDDFTRAAELAPGYVAARLNRALVLARLQRYDEAAKELDQTVHLAPRDAGLVRHHGRVLSLAGRLDASVRAYDNALTLAPGRTDWLRERGRVLLQARRYYRAWVDFNRLVELDPDMVQDRWSRAQAALGSGRLAEGRTDYDLVITLEPGNPDPMNELAWFLATFPNSEYRDGQRAVSLAETALNRAPDRIDLRDTLAAALAEKGDFARAVTLQEEAVGRLLSAPGAPDRLARLKEYQARLAEYRKKTAHRARPEGALPYDRLVLGAWTGSKPMGSIPQELRILVENHLQADRPSGLAIVSGPVGVGKGSGPKTAGLSVVARSLVIQAGRRDEAREIRKKTGETTAENPEYSRLTEEIESLSREMEYLKNEKKRTLAFTRTGSDSSLSADASGSPVQAETDAMAVSRSYDQRIQNRNERKAEAIRQREQTPPSIPQPVYETARETIPVRFKTATLTLVFHLTDPAAKKTLATQDLTFTVEWTDEGKADREPPKDADLQADLLSQAGERTAKKALEALGPAMR